MKDFNRIYEHQIIFLDGVFFRFSCEDKQDDNFNLRELLKPLEMQYTAVNFGNIQTLKAVGCTDVSLLKAT